MGRPGRRRPARVRADAVRRDPEVCTLLGSILSHRRYSRMQSRTRAASVPVMIEDPSSAHDYMNDPEVEPILLRVHSILASIADRHTGNDAGVADKDPSDDSFLSSSHNI